MTLNAKRSDVFHMHITNTWAWWVPNFKLVHSMASHFPDTGYFEKSALNDSKMTNTKGQRYPDPIYMSELPSLPGLTVPLSFTQFCSAANHLRITGHFEESPCTEWPKMTLNTKRSQVKICVLQVPPVLNFTRLCYMQWGSLLYLVILLAGSNKAPDTWIWHSDTGYS